MTDNFNYIANDLDRYQFEASLTAVFPKEMWKYYLPLKLAGEAGEVAEKFGKWVRDGGSLNDEAIIKELGDVLWYVAVLANELGYDLSEVAEVNLSKLRDRMERGVIKGSGDNR